MAKAKAKAESEGEPANGELPSKMKMVEAALDTLGLDTAPGALQPWIQDKYHTEIDKQMISSYASQIRKKRRGGASGSVRLPAAHAAAGTIGVRDVALLSDLIERVGPAELQSLIKVLSK